MTRRPPRSTLFPYNDALPICRAGALQKSWPQRKRPGGSRVCGGVSELFCSRRSRPCQHGASRVATSAAERTKFSLTSPRSEEHTSELQSLTNLVCRLLLEKKK